MDLVTNTIIKKESEIKAELTPADERQLEVESIQKQYKESMRQLIAADYKVLDQEKVLAGMHEVLEELKRKRTDRSEWKKGKALLDGEDRVTMMTAATPAETGLQSEIDAARW